MTLDPKARDAAIDAYHDTGSMDTAITAYLAALPPPTVAVKWAVYDWEYTKPDGSWGYARTPERAKQLTDAGVAITPVYVPDTTYLPSPPPQGEPVTEAAQAHAIHRTSPKGTPFVGTCSLCGQIGLTTSDISKPCPNVRGVTQNEALIEAIDPPHRESRIVALRTAAEMVIDWWHEWQDKEPEPEERVAFEALEAALSAQPTAGWREEKTDV